MIYIPHIFDPYSRSLHFSNITLDITVLIGVGCQGRFYSHKYSHLPSGLAGLLPLEFYFSMSLVQHIGLEVKILRWLGLSCTLLFWNVALFHSWVFQLAGHKWNWPYIVSIPNKSEPLWGKLPTFFYTFIKIIKHTAVN